MSPDNFVFAPKEAFPPRHKSAFAMTIVFMMILVVGYIVFRSSAIFLVPELEIQNPPNGALLNDRLITVAGTTEPKTKVTINGYETFSDKEGAFNVFLPFQKGFHILDVRVKNRVGKESRVVRHVVVE